MNQIASTTLSWGRAGTARGCTLDPLADAAPRTSSAHHEASQGCTMIRELGDSCARFTQLVPESRGALLLGPEVLLSLDSVGGVLGDVLVHWVATRAALQLLAPGVRFRSWKSAALSLVSLPSGTRATDLFAPGGPEPKALPSMNMFEGDTAPHAMESTSWFAGSKRPTPPSSEMPAKSEPWELPTKFRAGDHEVTAGGEAVGDLAGPTSGWRRGGLGRVLQGPTWKVRCARTEVVQLNELVGTNRARGGHFVDDDSGAGNAGIRTASAGAAIGGGRAAGASVAGKHPRPFAGLLHCTRAQAQ